MPLRPEISIPAALATGTIVYAVYGRGMPPNIDMRASAAGDDMAETVRKQNAWMAAATVAGISLIAKDPVVFIVGGAMVVALDWMTRANIWASPTTNAIDTGPTMPAKTAPGTGDYGSALLQAVP